MSHKQFCHVSGYMLKNTKNLKKINKWGGSHCRTIFQESEVLGWTWDYNFRELMPSESVIAAVTVGE